MTNLHHLLRKRIVQDLKPALLAGLCAESPDSGSSAALDVTRHLGGCWDICAVRGEEKSWVGDMTTAARPTFEPARGGRGKGEGDLSALSKQYSSRDLPGHTKIKYRQPTQDAPEEVRGRDFRRELEERERVAVREKTRERGPREHTTSSSSSSKRPRLDQIPAANLDADDPLTDDDEDNDSEEDSDDDTAALLAELEKIKKERAEEQERKEREQKAEEERIRMENILSGNPLLNLGGQQQMGQTQTSFTVKRRWDDDVVFKNCAKGVDDSRKEKRFVNDTLRSEFHKKFMEKYVK
ncbi:protein CWC15-like [Arapaima gigas]